MTADKTVAVIGLGKIGLPLSLCFAARGITVKGYDISAERRLQLRDVGPSEFELQHEKGLVDAMAEGKNRFTISDDVAGAIIGASMSFLIVPTPSTSEGDFSLSFVSDAIREIGTALRNRTENHVIVIVSTVSPRATNGHLRPTLEAISGIKCGQGISLCYSPTLIALGNVFEGILQPDFAFVGECDRTGANRLEAFYRSTLADKTPIMRMSAESVEIAKLALNNYLTMKIGFANLIGHLCARTDKADVMDVMVALGTDKRIGHLFLSAGIGFGGPCLPRDTAALKKSLAQAGLPHSLPETIAMINSNHVSLILELIGDLRGETVAVIGLGYKARSPHIIDSFPVSICNEMARTGVDVVAVDPLIAEMDLSSIAPTVTVVTDIALAPRQPVHIVLAGGDFSEDSLASIIKFGGTVYDIIGNVAFRNRNGIVQFGSSGASNIG